MVSEVDAVYIMRSDVALEAFGEDALLFQSADCSVRSVNRVLRDVLYDLDGSRSVCDVATRMASIYGEPFDRVLPDVADILKSLQNNRILKRRLDLPFVTGRTYMQADDQYMVNPDVSCRIEDADGAILYNPDTDGVQVINPIGLEIWETLSEPRSITELVDHIQSVCDGVTNEVERDVRSFVELMLAKGFMGIVQADGLFSAPQGVTADDHT